MKPKVYNLLAPLFPLVTSTIFLIKDAEQFKALMEIYDKKGWRFYNGEYWIAPKYMRFVPERPMIKQGNASEIFMEETMNGDCNWEVISFEEFRTRE